MTEDDGTITTPLVTMITEVPLSPDSITVDSSTSSEETVTLADTLRENDGNSSTDECVNERGDEGIRVLSVESGVGITSEVGCSLRETDVELSCEESRVPVVGGEDEGEDESKGDSGSEESEGVESEGVESEGVESEGVESGSEGEREDRREKCEGGESGSVESEGKYEREGRSVDE